MIQSFIEISLTNYCSHGDFDDHHPPTCFFSNPGVADVKAFALELSENKDRKGKDY